MTNASSASVMARPSVHTTILRLVAMLTCGAYKVRCDFIYAVAAKQYRLETGGTPGCLATTTGLA